MHIHLCKNKQKICMNFLTQPNSEQNHKLNSAQVEKRNETTTQLNENEKSFTLMAAFIFQNMRLCQFVIEIESCLA